MPVREDLDETRSAPELDELDSAAGDEPTDDEIAFVAYELFKESGGEHGHDLEHWFAAKDRLQATRRDS